MTADRARILAQLVEHGRPMSAAALAEALAWEPAYVECEAVPLVRAGLVRRLRPMASRVPLLEPTERGALEGAGGAQLRIDGAPDRAPMNVQPALF